MPCSLSEISLVTGYVGGTGQKGTKRAFGLAVAFAVGSAITFTALGAIASTAGHLIGTSAKWWYLLLGGLMGLMALQTWGLYEVIPSSYLVSKKQEKGLCGCYPWRNIFSSVFNTCADCPACDCCREGHLLWEIMLLLFYSVGHGMLAVVARTSIVVIADGKIAQQGTHEQLIKQPGIYADFINVRHKAIGWKL